MDFSELSETETTSVLKALERQETIVSHIGSKALSFVMHNFNELGKLDVLEENWMQAYTHASHFADYTLKNLMAVFDECDRTKLQKAYPIYVGDHFSNGKRFSLFRGCAGPDHRMGMSWTSSLDKAILYAARHSEYYDLDNRAVYTAVVDRDEIYCCGNHYDYDFIVLPQDWWRISIPEEEYRLDRPR